MVVVCDNLYCHIVILHYLKPSPITPLLHGSHYCDKRPNEIEVVGYLVFWYLGL